MGFFTRTRGGVPVKPPEVLSNAPATKPSLSERARLLERRKYKRYRTQGSGAQPWCSRFSQQRFSLVDLSFGGLSMQVSFPPDLGSIHELQLDLDSPISDSVTVTIAIRRLEAVGNRWLCGAEFLKSSKAWLGPE